MDLIGAFRTYYFYSTIQKNRKTHILPYYTLKNKIVESKVNIRPYPIDRFTKRFVFNFPDKKYYLMDNLNINSYNLYRLIDMVPWNAKSI